MKSNQNYTQKYLESSITQLNSSGNESLKANHCNKAFFFFSQAFVMCKTLPSSCEKKNLLLSSTLISLGNYYKVLNNLPESLKHFQEALLLEPFLSSNLFLVSSTHMQVSSIYSLQENHELSLRHVLKSLYLLRRSIVNTEEHISRLIIAYYNAGVEYEHLKQLTDAKDCYLKGYSLSIDRLGVSHQLTKQIRDSLDQFLKENKNKGNCSDKGKDIRIDLVKVRRQKSAESSSRRRLQDIILLDVKSKVLMLKCIERLKIMQQLRFKNIGEDILRENTM